MKTRIAPQFQALAEVKIAEQILRNCVHCGFCTATCPTYLQSGNELNSPRGRIYLIKQLLEGQSISQHTQHYLDTCLQCHNCETTCPSGVDYGRLYETGQKILAQSQQKPLPQRLKIFLLRQLLPYPQRFGLLYRIFRIFYPLLPNKLQKQLKLPARVEPLQPSKGRNSTQEATETTQVLLFQGCVQRVLAPEINQSILNLLSKLGKQGKKCSREQCCGAIDWHSGAYQAAKSKMKHNIDLWLKENKPVIISASGCSSFIKQYAQHLADDPDYAAKAKQILPLCQDTVDYFTPQRLTALKFNHPRQKIACHTPCTLQHWQKKPHVLENTLKSCGIETLATQNPHLCCGSAGLYSVLQPTLSQKIRQQKIQDLTINQPQKIVSNNIGCINHLQQELNIPIQHWCQLLDQLSQP